MDYRTLKEDLRNRSLLKQLEEINFFKVLSSK